MSAIKAHPGAFCFCDFQDSTTGEVERVYNASWLPVPRYIHSRTTGKRADCIRASIRFAPEHVPAFGDRVLIAVTDHTARVDARRLVEQRIKTYGEAEVRKKFDTWDAAVASAYDYLKRNGLEPVFANTAIIEQLKDLREQLGPVPPPTNDNDAAGDDDSTDVIAKQLLASLGFSGSKLLALMGFIALLSPVLPRLGASKGEDGCFDRQGKPISLERWFDLFAENLAPLERDTVGQVRVTTGWIGVDMNETGGTPIIYETMVSSSSAGELLKQYRRRYATEAEARAGHREVLARVRERYARAAL